MDSKLTDIENRVIDHSRASETKLTDIENREIDLTRLVLLNHLKFNQLYLLYLEK